MTERNHRLPDYNTTWVSDPPSSSVVIMFVSACKHKLVCRLQGTPVICTRHCAESIATVLCICMRSAPYALAQLAIVSAL